MASTDQTIRIGELAAYRGERVVFVLHDNPEWLPPIREAFAVEGVPLVSVLLDEGAVDLGATPPEGVYWSRLSASSHTRDLPQAKETARALLRWIESHGRPVVNGSRVLELEVSKVAQYAALQAAGFDLPRTFAVSGRASLLDAASRLPLPFITKHNQGGKGLGVQRFDSLDEFTGHVQSSQFEAPVDGIELLQEYVPSSEPFITRAEFVGGEFVYAVRVDTSAGSFELCPAEACVLPAPGEAPTAQFAAATCEIGAPGMFTVRNEITADDPLIRKLAEFLREEGIEIAGVEFIETADGRRVVYDINTNTNYNPDVEAVSSVSAARQVARELGARLQPAGVTR